MDGSMELSFVEVRAKTLSFPVPTSIDTATASPSSPPFICFGSQKDYMMNSFKAQKDKVELNLERDYISNLPRNVKESILVKLPIKEAVRTSLLSTKWKYVWRSIPDLVFTDECVQSNLIRLIDMVLLMHQGPIRCFRLVSNHTCNEAIGRWIHVLSRNGIKSLYIRFNSVEKCKIPSSFFSCLKLEHVLISNSSIHVPQGFQVFKFLQTLRILQFKLTGISLDRVVSGCPSLEILELAGFVEYGRLVIHAPNLQWLSITGEFADLLLETPKLHFAKIYLNGEFGDYLDFIPPRKECQSTIVRVLGSLSVIEELVLCSDFITYLAKGPIPEVQPVPFYRLTELHIDLFCTCKEEVAAAFCLFRSTPNLKMLSLMFDKEDIYQPKSYAESWWEVNRIESQLFKCLENFKITQFAHPELILILAKIVLSNAPVLEKLVIRECDVDGLMDGMEFLKKLASFRRLSKMAEIVFV